MGLENFAKEDAKQKVKSLRVTYQQESHKIHKSLSPGAGLEDVYKPFNYSSTLFAVHFTFDSFETTLRTLHLKLNLRTRVNAACFGTC